MTKKLSRGISQLINKLHGIDKQQPLREGINYTTGNGEEIKPFVRKGEKKVRKMDNNTFNELFNAGEIDLIMMDHGENLTQQQLDKVVEFSKLTSQLTLQAMGAKVASQPGYKEFMSSPMMSSMTKKSSASNSSSPTQQASTPAAAPSVSPPKAKKVSKKKNKKNDPNHSTLGKSPIQNLRAGDSEADLLARMFILQKEEDTFYKKQEKIDAKYRKRVDKDKDRRLEEVISALSGKKPSKIKGVIRKASDSGLLKYGLIGAAAVGGLLVSRKAFANINLDTIFNDLPKFEDAMEEMKSSSAFGGAKAGDWKNDIDFMTKVNKFAEEKGMKASDLLAVMASESGFDPSIVNPKSGATGLIQFTEDTAKGLGTSTKDLAKMSRSEQFEYVKKFLNKGGLKKGATAGDIYALTYLPGRKDEPILSKKGESYYEGNKEFDVEKKGYITKQDLQQRAERKKKEFNIEDVQISKIEKNRENISFNDSNGEIQIKKIAEGSGIESYGTMKPEGVVFHHTGGETLQGAIATMRDKKRYGYQQATQYVIDKDGSIYQLQSDTAITYHAGTKPGESKFGNWNSIGVEVVAPTSEKFTSAQMESSFKLGKFLSKKYGIPYANIVGHGEISKNKMATEGKPIANLFRDKNLSSLQTETPNLKLSSNSLSENRGGVNNTVITTVVQGSTTVALNNNPYESNRPVMYDVQYGSVT